MRCPVCDDTLSISADRCTFCGYDFNTGKRGKIEAPPPNAASDARKQGWMLVVVGIPAMLGAALLLLLPSMMTRVAALVALPAAGGVFAKGLTSLAQAKRWDLKQRLAEEMRPSVAASSSATHESSAAIPTLRRD